jgi:hypothetical protein
MNSCTPATSKKSWRWPSKTRKSPATDFSIERLKMGGGQSAAAFAFGFLTLEIWWSFIVRRRAICQNR